MMINPMIPLGIAIPLAVLAAALTAWDMIHAKRSIRYNAYRLIRTGLIIALLFAMNLRPMREMKADDVQMRNLDVLLVVDDTISMWADDYSGRPRIEGVKETCAQLVTELEGANFGLIRFDNRAQIMAPFTQDTDNVMDALDVLEVPDVFYARGSSLNTPHDAILEMLLSSSKKKDRQAVVFLFSDGEETKSGGHTSYADLSGYISGGAVLGYGTPEGGRMKTSGGIYVYDYEEHGDAVSRIDEESLMRLADEMNVEYIHVNGQTVVKHVAESIKKKSSFTRGQGNNVVYEDVYYVFAAPLLAILVLELAAHVLGGIRLRRAE